MLCRSPLEWNILLCLRIWEPGVAEQQLPVRERRMIPLRHPLGFGLAVSTACAIACIFMGEWPSAIIFTFIAGAYVGRIA